MFNNNTITKAYEIINSQSARSAWKQGVRAYAWDMLEQLDDAIAGGWFDAEDLAAPRVLSKHLLNGADSWSQASWGGSWFCYDGEIAERLCSPSELKRTKGGKYRPNRWEDWLDVQTRALEQAACLVVNACRQAAKEVA